MIRTRIKKASHFIFSKDARNVAVSQAAKDAVPQDLIVKANLKALTIDALQEWGMIVLTWMILILGPSWLYPFGVLVICGRFNALGALLHDACHVKRSNSRYSTVIDYLAAYPIGLSIEGMRYHHIRHHRHACTDLDPYLKPAANKNTLIRLLCYLRGILVIVAWFIRPYFGLLARYMPHLKNVYGKLFFGDKTKDDLRKSKQLELCMQRDIGQMLYQGVLMILSYYYFDWMLQYYFVPLIFASILNSYRVVEEHIQQICHDHSTLTIINYTNDQPMSALSRFLFFPRNIGYHRMHHLHPSARYQQLPVLQRWYENYQTPEARKLI